MINKLFKLFCLLVISFLYKQSSYANNINYEFKRITVEDGLSASWIRDIEQDTLGFMWFATENGLNKFDGYEFTVYKYDKDNKFSLPDNTVNCILTDSQGKMFLGTNKGAVAYSHELDQFILLDSLIASKINCMIEGNNNDLWIASETDGLINYNFSTDSIIKFHQSDSPMGLSSNNVTYVYKDLDKNIWIGTEFGLHLLNENTGELYVYKQNRLNPNSISNEYVRCIEGDTYGNLWIGTNNGGLNLFVNAKQRPFTGEFISYQYDRENPQSITNGAILSLSADANGNLWIGTENGGLDVFEVSQIKDENPTFQHFKNDPDNDVSLSNNSVYALFLDNSNNIWAGTFGKGLNYVNTRGKKFGLIQQQTSSNKSLSHDHVNVLLQDGDTLWIGTEGGLDKLLLSDFTVSHYVHNDEDNTSLGSNAVWALFKDNRNNLWVGTWAGGLNKFDYKTGTFIKYKNNPDDPASINNNNIFSINQLTKDELLIGTMGGGLNIYNYNTKEFRHTQSGGTSGFTLQSNFVSELTIDSYKQLWLSSINHLERYNPGDDSFASYHHLDNDTNSLPIGEIVIIFEDSKSTLWIGSKGGLSTFNPELKTFTNYTVEDGLPGNIIQGILEDNDENLWLSTNLGISKFINGIHIPEKPEFKNYYKSDGLQGNEFVPRSCLRTRDGRMFFGGPNGISYFHPDSLKENKFIPPVVITKLHILNKPVSINDPESPLTESISLTKKIVLTHKQSVITFTFSALNYQIPEKNQFAYRLDNFDPDKVEWNHVGNKRTATYTNLNPKTYTFRVIASNNDGVWNEEGTSIEIKVLPPWWKTKWFIGLYIVLFIFFIWRFIKSREEKLKKDREYLQTELDKGKALIEKNQKELELKQEEIRIKEKEGRANKFLNEGLALFSEIFSQDYDDLKSLCDSVLLNLLKYIDAQMGGIFILNDTDESEQYLELISSFAYNKEKKQQLKFEIGEGRVGSCFKDGVRFIDKSVHEDYFTLESGLGKTKPNYIIYLPLKQLNNKLGLIEIALLNELEEYKLEFLDKVSENITSTLMSRKTNLKTEVLYKESLSHAQEMSSKEKELQQHLEELKATQEESDRREKELLKLTDKFAKKEQSLMKKMVTIENTKKELLKQNKDLTEELGKQKKKN